MAFTRIFSGLILLLASGLPFQVGSGKPLGSPSEVSGTWSDACPCAAPCPCWRTLKSSVRNCVNVQTFQVEQGRYKGADLSGAIFLLLSSSQRPGEAPVPERLFIAESTTEVQANAIRALVERQLGEVEVSRTRLTFVANGDWLEASAGSFISYRVRSAGRSEPKEEVKSYLYPWLSGVQQWISEDVTYRSADGKNLQYSKTNSLYGRFRIPTDDHPENHASD